jgi:hypothetical protein
MVDGIRFRTVQGYKSERDVRLEWQIPGGQWRAISMVAGAIMADAWYCNEDVLYPREAGLLGGEKYAKYLGVAMREGWQAADAILQSEKAASRTSAAATSTTVDVEDGPAADWIDSLDIDWPESV